MHRASVTFRRRAYGSSQHAIHRTIHTAAAGIAENILQLHQLELDAPDELSFAGLTRCRRLTHLSFEGQTNEPHFSELQVQQLRTLRQATTMIFVWNHPPLQSLLAPGHSLQVTDLGELDLHTQADCDALANLPSFTQLKCHFREFTCPANIDFVRSLPLLQQLGIFFTSDKMLPQWPRIARCSRLTRLSLDNSLLDTDQLQDCLAHMCC